MHWNGANKYTNNKRIITSSDEVCYFIKIYKSYPIKCRNEKRTFYLETF